MEFSRHGHAGCTLGLDIADDFDAYGVQGSAGTDDNRAFDFSPIQDTGLTVGDENIIKRLCSHSAGALIFFSPRRKGVGQHIQDCQGKSGK